MFGFGHAPELFLLLIVAVLFFGPKRIPAIGRSLGETVRTIRFHTSAVEQEAASIGAVLSSATALHPPHTAVTSANTPVAGDARPADAV